MSWPMRLSRRPSLGRGGLARNGRAREDDRAVADLGVVANLAGTAARRAVRDRIVCPTVTAPAAAVHRPADGGRLLGELLDRLAAEADGPALPYGLDDVEVEGDRDDLLAFGALVQDPALGIDDDRQPEPSASTGRVDVHEVDLVDDRVGPG